MAKYARKVKKNGIPVDVKVVEAWELTLEAPSTKLTELMEAGKICFHEDIQKFELKSQEAQDGGQLAEIGDFFKVDSSGFPYPNGRDFFIANHRHLDGDTYEQIPGKNQFWMVGMEVTPAMQFLMDKQVDEFQIHPESNEAFYTAFKWGTNMTGTREHRIVFYSVSTDANGFVTAVDWNMVAPKQWKEDYQEE